MLASTRCLLAKDYLVDHSIIHYFIGKNGKFLDFFGKNMTAKDGRAMLHCCQRERARERERERERVWGANRPGGLTRPLCPGEEEEERCGNGGLICLSERTDRTSRARTRAGGGFAFSLTVLKKRERERYRLTCL